MLDHNIPTWDEYFFNILEVVKTRSPDPRTHVACLLVKHNKILSTGYNGLPSGMKKLDLTNENKYPYMVHAEQNAIANAVKLEKSMTAYLTHLPCHVCLRLIWNAGVRIIKVPANRHVFSYADDDWLILSEMLNIGLGLYVGGEDCSYNTYWSEDVSRMGWKELVKWRLTQTK